MELQETRGPEGLQFVGIAIDDLDAVREFAQHLQINYPILIGEEDATSLSRRLGNSFSGLPYTVIFNREGGLVYGQPGELSKQQLEQILQQGRHGANGGINRFDILFDRNDVYTVNRAGRNTQVTTGAFTFNNRMHLFGGTENGIYRTSLDTQRATDADLLINHYYGFFSMFTVFFVERFGINTQ